MIEQRSPEWFSQRKGKITDSNVGAILGVNEYKSPADVMRQMVREWHGAEPEFKSNIASEYGKASESTAMQNLELFHLSAPVEEAGLYIHKDIDWLCSTPNGLIGNDGALEIKCPFGLRDKESPEFKSLFNQPKDFAKVQVLLACTGRTWCAFYQWSQHGDDYHEQAFSQAWFDEALPKLKAFYDAYLIERENPERYLKPRHEEQNERFIVEMVAEYKDLKQQAKALEEQARDVLLNIIEECGERESDIDGAKLSRVERKGSIDYKAVPQLEGVDLEQYRKASSQHWSLK